MQRAKAIMKFVRVPPRKARLAADLIRGRSIEKALAELAILNMRSSHLLKKVINSAVANAELNLDLKRERLHVLEVFVNEGPRLKRSKSKCRGSSVPVLKRMSHFTVVVGEK